MSWWLMEAREEATRGKGVAIILQVKEKEELVREAFPPKSLQNSAMLGLKNLSATNSIKIASKNNGEIKNKTFNFFHF